MLCDSTVLFRQLYVDLVIVKAISNAVDIFVL